MDIIQSKMHYMNAFSVGYDLGLQAGKQYYKNEKGGQDENKG